MGIYLKRLTSLSLTALMAALLLAGTVLPAGNFSVDRSILQQAEKKYGGQALRRLTAWEELIARDRSRSDRDKLDKVNRFFNERIRFASDWDVWGVEDYWATPIEFLAKGAGDCEDFAIAKYFTLKAMGVEDEKLRITYVKALRYNIHHMVLTYYSTPEAEPLVLDNLVDSIDHASKRNDLMPILSFNGSGLWLAKQRGMGKPAGKSSRLRLWQDLLQKMSENRL
ncbi:transglutaminase-like cysteine peptidase [Geomonas sp. Red69]|uniref:Transglutaminase-like cysteine peptidase n=1 Tax=Geomonas diazotrophica TaxID=2843197 RepID=A0ABX8JT21_9BACT|nr:transglutaminase-like cysteine peptidase [Geomonas diazotrophica]QWV99759.1 transglutaminase-like cysteine peptidase [Geomonas nitrogeniifigens]QXE88900.1 transglutaminase-like cysteine peptidase [Geomonas nitrogeniifigens]